MLDGNYPNLSVINGGSKILAISVGLWALTRQKMVGNYESDEIDITKNFLVI